MVLYILNLFDLASTLLAMAYGAEELNPIMRFIMGVPCLFPFIKIVPAYFLCIWLGRNAKKNIWAMIRYIAISILFAVVVAKNFYVFHIMR